MRPKYLQDVLDLLNAASAEGKPSIIRIAIEHEDWCALIKGSGDCTCDPKIGKPTTYL